LYATPGLVIFLISPDIGLKIKIDVVRSQADHHLKWAAKTKLLLGE
jgi:hypothetical protein